MAADEDDRNIDEELPNRETLISDAANLAGDDGELADLVRRYWRFVPDEDLAGRSAADLFHVTVAHRELASQRVVGEVKLSVTTPEAPEPDGEPAPPRHTSIDIVTDDMPFLVDSITTALTSRDLDIHVVVHPLVPVVREVMGALQSLPSHEDAEGAVAESWMHFEVDRLRDAEKVTDVHNAILGVLTDVRQCVEDWPRMRAVATELAAEIADDGERLPVPERDLTDAVELLRWLADNHFTFLGYREYRLADTDAGQALEAVGGSGLGLLRADQGAPKLLSALTPEAYEQVLEKRLLIVTKTNSRSTVHRHSYMDYVGFKVFDDAGNVIGERRFLGLFTTAAYLSSVKDLPVVSRKAADVMDRSGLSPNSHSGKDLMAILETYPRDELFQSSTDNLFHTAMDVLRLAGRRRLRFFARRDTYGRFFSCLVYLPRDRFDTDNRLKIQKILMARLNGVGIDFSTYVSESVLARIHLTVRVDPANPPGDVDVAAVQRELIEATRSWDADFSVLLDRQLGEDQSKDVYLRYVDAFSNVYKDSHSPREAAKDIAKLELVDEPGELALHLFRRRKSDEDIRFKVFRFGEPMMLSAVLPVLHSLGVTVEDEHPYEIERADGTVFLHDFGLRLPADLPTQVPQVRADVENAFSASWRGEAETDGFNALVLRAGLTWRQVVILRAYAKYLRQAGTTQSSSFMASTLCSHPQLAKQLVSLFETRFDPRLELTAQARDDRAAEIATAFEAALEDVPSLNADRVLRSYLGLIRATLRTSYYQRGSSGRPKSYVALKLDPQSIPELPEPRPAFEIFVYSPRFEGVHLRFGKVARGGLRWSDREDFRTEILGLVKAQMVKNTVIVPVGSKGGFLLKQAPSEREALQVEGVTCYKLFISALLDVTDNIDSGSGKVIPPPEVVRHDSDDTYLVVAADKGTATFSDIANGIANHYNFWLGDAFASGGSAGYDHKKMGITARGAWESVKRHFKTMGVDTQTTDHTCVGIGDMGGDVFGNGLMCSPHTRLIAAFNHMHIFIDPNPDTPAAYAERQRLFALPRSTWDDFNHDLISEGGGVWSRSAKRIPVSPQVRAALGIEDPVKELAPSDLIKAILRAKVDLLWNGGIGTYVKGSAETNADVGDKSNDPLRVDGAELRCTVVGEGGNLGLTQRGRIEAAKNGVRLATDFIDNSAGVDTSDHEVNIKVLLSRAIHAGLLPAGDRDQLLEEMTDEVARLALDDNYNQNTALAAADAQSSTLFSVHIRLMRYLSKTAGLNRQLEALPSDKEIATRMAAGEGLTEPELAVILSYVKIGLETEINDSDLPDEAWTKPVLSEYFPTPLRERFERLMPEHPLRREIVTTVLVNEAVNRGGTSFVFRAMEETGAGAADVLRAYVIVRDVFGLSEIWADIEALDNQIPAAAQTEAMLVIRRLLDRGVRWLVQNRAVPLEVPPETDRMRPGVSTLLPRVRELLQGTEAEGMSEYAETLVSKGVPQSLAERVAGLMYGFGLVDVVEVTDAQRCDRQSVADVYFTLTARFGADDVLNKISALPRDNRSRTLARTALRYDLYAALAALTRQVMATTPDDMTAAERVDQWQHDNAATLDRVVSARAEFVTEGADLASLSVLLRQIRTLAQASAARAH
ncbi:MAG TPA: NAD-glutamate dehydrogenase [Stackebrandtia sp.]|jgi:glutamate dehydrogenase|uniref:NAD-glutamate dehydrogenase n=1 Tax=Stackebrandtia sp. TaxID=2023065 RepID=UPI002D326A27|nr:NAD-glutamate dehydrogenase [Stackebrandtia sp.]HZE37437.1 NAD-glutamate dehydrogenase [Stackebrandtia sp.]